MRSAVRSLLWYDKGGRISDFEAISEFNGRVLSSLSCFTSFREISSGVGSSFVNLVRCTTSGGTLQVKMKTGKRRLGSWPVRRQKSRRALLSARSQSCIPREHHERPFGPIFQPWAFISSSLAFSTACYACMHHKFSPCALFLGTGATLTRAL